jgi:hypothetical protein
MIFASGNADVAFFMFWFDHAARFVGSDVAAGLLAQQLLVYSIPFVG